MSAALGGVQLGSERGGVVAGHERRGGGGGVVAEGHKRGGGMLRQVTAPGAAYPSDATATETSLKLPVTSPAPGSERS